jgi:hypothetical protein
MRELTDKELDEVAAGLTIVPPGTDKAILLPDVKFPEPVPEQVPPLRPIG